MMTAPQTQAQALVINDRTYDALAREQAFARPFDRLFYGMVTRAHVVRVVDGDTIDICLFFHKQPLHMRTRLYGINTPELRRGTKRAEAKAAKRYVRELLAQHDNRVVVKLMEIISFGRVLCEYFLPAQVGATTAMTWTTEREHSPLYHGTTTSVEEQLVPPMDGDALVLYTPPGHVSLNHMLVELGHAEYYMCDSTWASRSQE